MNLRIIGAGLGGISLAREFLRRGLSPRLYDAGLPGATDQATALVNPFNLRNFRPLLSPEALEGLRRWYSPHTRPLTLIHRFTSGEQRLIWENLQSSSPIPGELVKAQELPGPWNLEFGALKLPGAFQVLWPGFKAQVIQALGPNFHPQTFAPPAQTGDLTFSAPGWNPDLKDLGPPQNWKCAQGEFLRLRIPDLEAALPADWAIHGDHWLLQETPGIFRWGASYHWDTLDGVPRHLAALKDSFQRLWRGPFEILDHQAAVRPILADRRPRWVADPENPTWFLLGLGARGFSVIPALVQEGLQILDAHRPRT